MNYGVTLFVSQFGWVLGILFILLATAGGFLSNSPGGAIIGFLVSSALIVPFLMFCEGMHALVSIAINTKKDVSNKPQAQPHLRDVM